jgi:hypothetical protein
MKCRALSGKQRTHTNNVAWKEPIKIMLAGKNPYK